MQMRFPTPLPEDVQRREKRLVGPSHHNTLLDGEMVVDEDKATGQHVRRFLVYDVVVINDKPVGDQPFKVLR